MTCERYLILEEGLEASIDPFLSEEHDAYGAAVLIALHSFLAMTPDQFLTTIPWFSETLSKLILCDDIDVRSCVSDIYKLRINPLLTN